MQEARNLNFNLCMNDKTVMYIYIHIFVYTHTHICTHTHVYMYLYMHVCVCAQLFSCVWLCNPMTVAHQALLSMGLPKQEYWSGLPFYPPGDLPNPGIAPSSFASAGRFFTTEPPGSPYVCLCRYIYTHIYAYIYIHTYTHTHTHIHTMGY